jgi:hypothetical protein
MIKESISGLSDLPIPIKSGAKMTELYKEFAKSTEKMSKYWLNYISWMKPLSEYEAEKGKQE